MNTISEISLKNDIIGVKNIQIEKPITVQIVTFRYDDNWHHTGVSGTRIREWMIILYNKRLDDL